jgi:hypothetical protein
VQQPVSPAFGLPPTQAISPAQGIPTIRVGTPQGTPPYVIPANAGQPISAQRTATPPAGFGTLPPSATAGKKPRSRRGLLIGGVIGLVLVLAV